jgi:hypothetical protein
LPQDLATTNVLLGVMAAVSLLEAAALIALVVAGFAVYKRIMRVADVIERRHVAPVAAKVDAILGDLNDITATARTGVRRVNFVVRRFVDIYRQFRG